MRLINLPIKLISIFCIFLFFNSQLFSQDLKNNRSKYQEIIKLIKSEIEDKYFDPNFRGVKLNEKLDLAVSLIKEAKSEGEMMTVVANFLLELDDSHLFYIPPVRVSDIDYGWEMTMIGDKCFVTKVSAGSDAEAQGVKVGDEIYTVEGFIPTRENFWKINYFYRVLMPYPALNVIVIKPDSRKFQYNLKAKITKGNSVIGVTADDWKQFDWRLQKNWMERDRHLILNDIKGVFIWKMPSFNLLPTKVDDIFDKIKDGESLILDLRGNGGGSVDMLLRVIGNIFSEDVTIGTRKMRKGDKGQIAKSRGKKSFKGKIAVLIDSDSASASEVLAKVIQLEKRGMIFGDVSAGKVMESQIFTYKDSIDYVSPYAVSITVADLIMKDGKSLEKTGVIPDEKLLPTSKDLAEKRDIVLVRAFEYLGATISPGQAGMIFDKK